MHTVKFDFSLTTIIRILFIGCTSPLQRVYYYPPARSWGLGTRLDAFSLGLVLQRLHANQCLLCVLMKQDAYSLSLWCPQGKLTPSQGISVAVWSHTGWPTPILPWFKVTSLVQSKAMNICSDEIHFVIACLWYGVESDHIHDDCIIGWIKLWVVFVTLFYWNTEHTKDITLSHGKKLEMALAIAREPSGEKKSSVLVYYVM